ncbi:abc-type multidrug transport system, atpase component [hydrocarbon metagenome]|uniref:Abc-type multidrug transport system, atpase component n=1 Tax=hydrocarbon metagenome TaxID=938273 RepID=A0A0W8FEJ8_9ZZZZ
MYGSFTAVDRISFEIPEGEIFGLLGPNGAGKTTAISMLATLLKPTSGAAMINGHSIAGGEDGVRRSIGIVFQDQSLDEELTAFENMDFHGRLYRIPNPLRQEKIAELLALVELDGRQHDLVKTFSGGMRRRLEIARGLLHRPKVLFLDEPTLGLDPQTRNHLWEYIERLNREAGITIILTTHYMEEADRLCDRVAIIDHGRIVALDAPGALKEAVGGDVITITSPDPAAVASAVTAAGALRAEQYDGTVRINLQHAERHIMEIVARLSGNGVPADSISIRKPTLEDVFLHFTGRSMRDETADERDRMRMYQRTARR